MRCPVTAGVDWPGLEIRQAADMRVLLLLFMVATVIGAAEAAVQALPLGYSMRVPPGWTAERDATGAVVLRSPPPVGAATTETAVSQAQRAAIAITAEQAGAREPVAAIADGWTTLSRVTPGLVWDLPPHEVAPGRERARYRFSVGEQTWEQIAELRVVDGQHVAIVAGSGEAAFARWLPVLTLALESVRGP